MIVPHKWFQSWWLALPNSPAISLVNLLLLLIKFRSFVRDNHAGFVYYTNMPNYDQTMNVRPIHALLGKAAAVHFIYIYICIYIMDYVCQRYHKECSTRTCAGDCYHCWNILYIYGGILVRVTRLIFKCSLLFSKPLASLHHQSFSMETLSLWRRQTH